MRLHRGVQAEVLVSLALVMFTATALLLVIFLETHHSRIEALHPLLGRGFLTEASDPRFRLRGLAGGPTWRVNAVGEARAIADTDLPIDEDALDLANESARLGQPLVRSGAPWAAIYFATPDGHSDSVTVGRIEAPVSGLLLASLVLIDVSVFGLFGFTLLRRRVVGPLGRLVAAVRGIGQGDAPVAVSVEGADEIVELATAFNEMQAALATRTGALEKAVVELRGANRSLVQAREGLDRAERLAMVGSMAAGVAHEVGNPMGAMLAFLDVAARDDGLSDESRHCLTRASEQGERVRLILRQLLDFSRPPDVRHGPISLCEIANQAVELVAAQPEFSNIEFEVVAEESLPMAQGDASLASQILLNLVLNAAAALETEVDPRIRLRLETGAQRSRLEDSAGEWTERRLLDSVVCWVEDSGPGVTTLNSERIFDPFFTTKAPGKGTGLGLANARRLADKMGGWVELDATRSELGGARFAFRLGTQAAALKEGEPREIKTRRDDVEAR